MTPFSYVSQDALDYCMVTNNSKITQEHLFLLLFQQLQLLWWVWAVGQMERDKRRISAGPLFLTYLWRLLLLSLALAGW